MDHFARKAINVFRQMYRTELSRQESFGAAERRMYGAECLQIDEHAPYNPEDANPEDAATQLADWARTIDPDSQPKVGVIVAWDGTIHGTTFHSENAWYVRRTPELNYLMANEIGIATRDLRKHIGEEIYHVTYTDVCMGQVSLLCRSRKNWTTHYRTVSTI